VFGLISQSKILLGATNRDLTWLIKPSLSFTLASYSCCSCTAKLVNGITVTTVHIGWSQYYIDISKSFISGESWNFPSPFFVQYDFKIDVMDK
jgi:hypothetical protein